MRKAMTPVERAFRKAQRLFPTARITIMSGRLRFEWDPTAEAPALEILLKRMEVLRPFLQRAGLNPSS